MQEEKIKKLYEKYDENKNGVMERNEFAKLLKVILEEIGENYPEKRHNQVVDEAMKNFDANKNGTFEFCEFAQVMDYMINEKGYELN